MREFIVTKKPRVKHLDITVSCSRTFTHKCRQHD